MEISPFLKFDLCNQVSDEMDDSHLQKSAFCADFFIFIIASVYSVSSEVEHSPQNSS
jgi:hypothetical protein